MKRKAALIGIFCLYVTAVLYLCLMKPDDMPQVELYFFGIPMDKLGHFLMFMPFPLLSYMLFYDRRRGFLHEMLILAAITAAGIGLAFGTEQLQALTQYRTQDINDAYSDMIGLAFGCIATTVLIIIKTYRNRK